MLLITPPCSLPWAAARAALVSITQVPRNMRLVAVPLYELYDNIARCGASSCPSSVALLRCDQCSGNTRMARCAACLACRYGPVLASLPLLLCRYRLNLVQAPGPALPPPGAPSHQADHHAQQQQQRTAVGAS